MLALPGELARLLVEGTTTLRAFGADGAELWSTEQPLTAQNVAAGGGAVIVSHVEGNVAGYRVSA